MSLADDLIKLEELRRTGALTETEFAQAKAAVLAGAKRPAGDAVAENIATQLTETRFQNELERIDRAWAIEKEQYLVTGKHGRRYVPTVGESVAGAVIGGAFGTFWTIMALAITSGAPSVGAFVVAKFIFPLFGIIVTLGAIGHGVYAKGKAEAYTRVFEAYKRRRAAAERSATR